MKKKKILLFLLIIICLTMIGCRKKDELASDEVILENIKYKLDQDEEEYGIKYKIASNFRKTVLPNAINYFSEYLNDKSYFVIRIFYYKNKDLEYAIKDSVESYDKREEVKIDNLDYTKVHFINYNSAETNLYYYQYQNDIYTFVFTSSIDLSRLEDIFLKSIIYE